MITPCEMDAPFFCGPIVQQTADRAAARAGVQTTQRFGHVLHANAAPATAVPLLQRGDGHRASKNLAAQYLQ
jgi:hypothetical protein